MFQESLFGVADYVVFVIFLAVSLGIGIFYGVCKRPVTTDEYFYGNRKMARFPVAISLLVTYQTATSCLGTPADVYNYDVMIFFTFLGVAFSTLVATFTIVPLLYPLKLNSAYDYLGRRFNSRAVQLLGTYIGMLQTLLYMSVVLFSPALALEAVAGIPLWMSVVVVGIIGTIYTSLGGFKSVIWTDVFQFIILYGGIILVFIMGGEKTGSLGKIMQVSKDGGRLDFNASFDPRVRHSLWSCTFGMLFTHLPNYCNQSAVQRICSMRSMRDAKIAMLINLPLILLFGGVLMFMGLVLYAYFAIQECGPVQAGYINNLNQLMPYFVILILGNVPALTGIFIAALFSGTLSSLSSGINALATNTLQDVLVNYLGKMSQLRQTLIAKLCVFGYGTLAIIIAYAMKEMPGPVTQIANTAFGACGGPYLGMYCLGAIFPQANWIGALSGGIVGIVFNVWLAVSSVLHGHPAPRSPLLPTTGCPQITTLNPNTTLHPLSDFMDNSTFLYDSIYSTDSVFYNDSSFNSSLDFNSSLHDFVSRSFVTGGSTGNPVSINTQTMEPSSISDDEWHMHIYDISYLWFGLTGFLVSLVTGMFVSLCSGKDKYSHTDPKYIFPFLRKFWAFKYTSNRSSYIVSDKRRDSKSKRASTTDIDAIDEASPWIRALEYNTLERLAKGTTSENFDFMDSDTSNSEKD